MSASPGQARPGPGVWWLSPEGWPALEVVARGPFSDTAAAGSSTSLSLCGPGDEGGWTPGRRAAKVPPSWCRPLAGRLGPTVEGWGPSAGGRGWVCGYGRLTGRLGLAWGLQANELEGDYRMLLAAPASLRRMGPQRV